MADLDSASQLSIITGIDGQIIFEAEPAVTAAA